MNQKEQDKLEKRVYDIVIPKQRRPDFVMYTKRMKKILNEDMKINYKTKIYIFNVK